MKNKIFAQIKPYLKRSSVDHAIMITGKWGSGKTYYLKKDFKTECEKLKIGEKNLKLLYVSANGITHFGELLEQLKWQKMPGIGTKTGKIIGKFGSVILESNLLSLAMESALPGSSIVKKAVSFLSKNFIKKMDKKTIEDLLTFAENEIIIIDDLERVHSNCDLIGLLGEINTQFVEHNGNKTILVCDEDELKIRFNGDRKERKLPGTIDDYQNAYGKVVRRKYIFKNELVTIIPELINGDKIVSQGDINIFLCDPSRIHYITRCLELSKIENLRDIIFFIETLVISLRDISKDNRVLLFEMLCRNSLIDSTYYRNGELSEETVMRSVGTGVTILPLTMDDLTASSESKNKVTLKENIFNALIEDLGGYTPYFSFTKRIVYYGEVDQSFVSEGVNNYLKSNGLDSEESKVLKRLYDYKSYSNHEELDSDIDKACTMFAAGAFNLDHFYNFFGTIEQLLECGIKTDIISDHSSFAKYCIEHLSKVNVDSQYFEDGMAIRRIRDLSRHANSKEYDELKSEYQKLINAKHQQFYKAQLSSQLNAVLEGKRSFNEFDNELPSFLTHLDDQFTEIIDHFINDHDFRHRLIEGIEKMPGPIDRHGEEELYMKMVQMSRDIKTKLGVDINNLDKIAVSSLDVAIEKWKEN